MRLILSSSASVAAGERPPGDWEAGEVGGGMGALREVVADEMEGVRLSFASGWIWLAALVLLAPLSVDGTPRPCMGKGI